MTKQDLIEGVNRNHIIGSTYEMDQIIDLINLIDEPNTIPETTINDLKDVLHDLKKIMPKNDPFKTIACYVSIGKSKENIYYEFLASSFVRIEGVLLFLNSDHRRLKLDASNILFIREQLKQ